MKIRFYSDLHLEFGRFRVPDPDPETILILAGDIGVKLSALSFIERQCASFKAVIYVLGNHEFYNSNMNDVISRWSKVSHLDNFFFLNDSSLEIGGIRFLGSTLWTDMNKDDFAIKRYIALRMNDFKMIRVGKESYSRRNKQWLTPEMVVCLHKKSVDFLETELSSSNQKTIVITHHSPTVNGLDVDRYGVSELSYAYYTPLEHIMDANEHLTHWIFGHTHKTLDLDVYGTRVLSNPRGYIGHEVNKTFNPNWEIEI